METLQLAPLLSCISPSAMIKENSSLEKTDKTCGLVRENSFRRPAISKDHPERYQRVQLSVSEKPELHVADPLDRFQV